MSRREWAVMIDRDGSKMILPAPDEVEATIWAQEAGGTVLFRTIGEWQSLDNPFLTLGVVRQVTGDPQEILLKADPEADSFPGADEVSWDISMTSTLTFLYDFHPSRQRPAQRGYHVLISQQGTVEVRRVTVEQVRQMVRLLGDQCDREELRRGLD